MNDNTNVEMTPEQKALTEKQAGLIAFLAEEPAARLLPKIHVTERAIVSDIILELAKEKTNEVTNTNDAGEDAEAGTDSTDEAPADGPTAA